ncbi:hypothetical protein ACFXAS_05895 [Streptomyces sp. NPDC059459]|uniref:hypothetical protein n=1 Tax=Streptomyces sp. NPDC059459 TaxID=3346839 RepID=UPI003682E568
MEGKDFATQAIFRATLSGADGMGSGNLVFSLYEEYRPEDLAPLRPEEFAAVVRDWLASKGWTMDRAYGQVNDQPLDWPEEQQDPEEPPAPDGEG